MPDPVYITQEGALLRKEDERLKLIKDNEVLMDCPLIKISEVICFGRVGISSSALAALMDRNIGIAYFTQHGHFIGKFHPAFSKNVLLRSLQYRAHFDSQASLKIAIQFVKGKLSNYRIVLRRAARNAEESRSEEITKAAKQIIDIENKLDHAENIASLRGYEGAGSAAYFGVFDALLKQPGFQFTKRIKHPPTDPVNSLLSFGYSLLTNEMQSVANLVGFDPYIGYLHTEQYGRPSLALDLMEEFRPLIVDSVVLTCINKNIIKPTAFQTTLGGTVRLNDQARKTFLYQYEDRKTTEIIHPVFQYSVSYARCFELQARILAKYLHNEIPLYLPLVTK